MKSKYGYILLWRGRKYERYSEIGESMWTVKTRFCEEHRIKKTHEVDIFLAEKDGAPVTQHQ